MRQNSSERLGTESVPRLMLSLAIPSLIAQMINVLYNIVDRMYLGHIEGVGDLALTGVGITFPILMLISAFSSFVGAGGAPLAAIQLGMGNRDRAEKILGTSAALLLCFSAVLTVVFSLTKTPLLYAFGASDQTVLYGESYIQIYLLGTVFVQLALGLNPYISSQGQAKTAMLSVLIGAVINIALDPLFIFVFDMGVAGAALATVLSQAVSALWVVSFLLSQRSVLRLRRCNLRPDLKLVAGIGALGISPFIIQVTESAINIVLNSGLQTYGGDLYVGSMTILQSVMQLAIVPIMGFTQGVQPLISYNFGAGNFDRVRKTYRLLIAVSFSVSVTTCLLTVCFPEVFAAVFTDKEELIQLVGRVMPIFMSGIWMFGILMACQTTFMGLGQAKISLCIACLRKVVLLIPLALILPALTGDVISIYWSEPISDIVAASAAGITFLVTVKKILSAETLEKLRG